MKTHIVALGISAAALASCGVPDDGTTPDVTQVAGELTNPGHGHIHSGPAAGPSDGFTAVNPGGSHSLSSHSGRVIASVKVIAVFWGASVNPTFLSEMPAFYTRLTGSPVYMDWLEEYSINSIPIGRGSLGAAITISPFNTNAALSEPDVQNELRNQINAGSLPAPDVNSVYMLHFPPGITITHNGTVTCATGLCGWHHVFNFNGQSLVYAVLPDNGPGSGCDTRCGAADQLGNMTTDASHELIESVTDPDLNAWYDDSGGAEISDICQNYQTVIPGTEDVVPLQWSNRHGACVLGFPSGTIRGIGGKVFDLTGTGNQFPIDYTQWNGGADQLWTMSQAIRFSSLGNRCMDLRGGSTADHTTIQYFDCNGGAGQAWSFQGANIRGHGNKCIDLPSASTADHTLLQYYPCSASGSSNQHWTFTTAGEIRGLGNKCLDLPGASTADGTRVQYFTCNGGANQKWTVGPNGQIRGLGGKCLELQSSSTADHTPIQISTCTGAANQRWLIQGPIVGLGQKCIDLPSSNTADGTVLQYFGCRGGANQQWWFYP
ncbi:MAG TPA: ricin-type beta-trefoil lectin domain protein [Polyangia bacterium]|jgi:hypothetical protein